MHAVMQSIDNAISTAEKVFVAVCQLAKQPLSCSHARLHRSLCASIRPVMLQFCRLFWEMMVDLLYGIMAEYCCNLFLLKMLVVLGSSIYFAKVLELSDLHTFLNWIKHLQCSRL